MVSTVFTMVKALCNIYTLFMFLHWWEENSLPPNSSEGTLNLRDMEMLPKVRIQTPAHLASDHCLLAHGNDHSWVPLIPSWHQHQAWHTAGALDVGYQKVYVYLLASSPHEAFVRLQQSDNNDNNIARRAGPTGKKSHQAT